MSARTLGPSDGVGPPAVAHGSMPAPRWLAALVSTLALVACSDDPDCGVSGRTQACVCPGGSAGAQVCRPSGDWGPCDCGGGAGRDAGAEPDAAAGDAATSDDATTDAGTPIDAGAADSGTPIDAGPPDTGAPSCTDRMQNQGEADVDCGGPCPACGLGLRCGGDGDCASGICDLDRCASARTGLVREVEIVSDTRVPPSGGCWTVRCPVGKKVLSGGFHLPTTPPYRYQMHGASRPDGDDGWRVCTTDELNPSAPTVIYAVCGVVDAHQIVEVDETRPITTSSEETVTVTCPPGLTASGVGFGGPEGLGWWSTPDAAGLVDQHSVQTTHVIRDYNPHARWRFRTQAICTSARAVQSVVVIGGVPASTQPVDATCLRARCAEGEVAIGGGFDNQAGQSFRATGSIRGSFPEPNGRWAYCGDAWPEGRSAVVSVYCVPQN